jgi:hypothetical protein
MDLIKNNEDLNQWKAQNLRPWEKIKQPEYPFYIFKECGIGYGVFTIKCLTPSDLQEMLASVT